MDLDFLDKIWQGIGNIGADTDKFMKREMPFDSGWGAPAALVATYFGGPAVLEAMGEGAGAVGGASEGAGAIGGMGGYLDSLGIADGGFSGVGDFGMSINPATGMDWASTGSGLTSNGADLSYSSMNDYMNQAGVGDSGFKATTKPSFQQLLGKQLMSGNLGSSMGQRGSFQHQDAPVQRQAAFAATPAPLQVQDKQSELATLIALLKKKEFE